MSATTYATPSVQPTTAAGEEVLLTFDYKVSRDWVEAELARTGVSVPDRYTLTVKLSDLEPDARRRALASQRQLERERSSSTHRAESMVPVLDQPTEDPEEVLQAWGQAAADLQCEAAGHAKREAARDAARERWVEEAREWISVHGSQHLRQSLLHVTKNGLEFGIIVGLYLRERATAEMPGFVPGPANLPWEIIQERSNPAAFELEALAKASKSAEGLGDVQLGWIPRKQSLGSEGLEGVYGPVMYMDNYLGDKTLVCPLDLSRERDSFTRRLAMMVSSGISPLEAIRVLADNEPHVRFKQLLEQVHAKVAGGMQISEALAEEPDVFSSYYISMVRCGEDSGTLDQALGRLVVQ